jgi:DNA-binding response OmpR family regulator
MEEIMNPVNVLIIDDDPDIIELITDILSEQSYRTFSAKTGTDAISLFLSHPIDLAILDLHMPDMNGFATLELIRFFPRLIEIPVIILTGMTTEENRRRAEYLGISAFLEKPFSPNALLDLVRKLLASHSKKGAVDNPISDVELEIHTSSEI